MTDDNLYVASLKLKLEEFNLPFSAIQWLMMLWDVTQFFDDVADGDEISRGALDRTMWNSLISMNINDFFASNSKTLIPCMANCILKWQASDKAEKSGDISEMSFAWRASFYDLILMVLQICHGVEFAIENANKVMNMYGEEYDSYLKEFNNA